MRNSLWYFPRYSSCLLFLHSCISCYKPKMVTLWQEEIGSWNVWKDRNFSLTVKDEGSWNEVCVLCSKPVSTHDWQDDQVGAHLVQVSLQLILWTYFLDSPLTFKCWLVPKVFQIRTPKYHLDGGRSSFRHFEDTPCPEWWSFTFWLRRSFPWIHWKPPVTVELLSVPDSCPLSTSHPAHTLQYVTDNFYTCYQVQNKGIKVSDMS